ncbi:DNA polymerase epsilon subunit 3 [Sparganum proliferum]
MAEKPDDLYLPNAVIGRIIREALPEKTVVSREARSAISKAASSFILCVTSMASAHCEAGKRKTLAASDILGALRDMQFSSYESPLLEFLENYRTAMNAKKASKKNQAQNETSVNPQQASEVISLDEAETSGPTEEKSPKTVDQPETS